LKRERELILTITFVHYLRPYFKERKKRTKEKKFYVCEKKEVKFTFEIEFLKRLGST